MTEEQLITGLTKGDEKAFEQLFRAYFEPLVFFANKYLGSIDEAKDIVQEVMSSVYENRDSLHINQSLKSFLYTTVSNRSLNVLKHEEVKTRHHSIIKSQGSELDLEDLMETSELQARISKLMDELPEVCQRIFKMSRIDQKTNQEIADELQLSKRTVETQISKALKVLRNALKILIIQIILKNM